MEKSWRKVKVSWKRFSGRLLHCMGLIVLDMLCAFQSSAPVPSHSHTHTHSSNTNAHNALSWKSGYIFFLAFWQALPC